MRLNPKKRIHAFASLALSLLGLCSLLSSCGGGGGSSSSDSAAISLGENACPILGLPTRIINGNRCSEGSSPIVRVDLVFGNGTAGTCSGTLIGSQYVLTAAHCFIFQTPILTTVIVGGQSITAAKVSTDPNAHLDTANLVLYDDAAVIKLSRPTSVTPLPLITSTSTTDSTVFAIYGFGLDNNGVYNALRGSTMVTSDVSTDFLFAKFDGTSGGDTCKGDSGGPAIARVTDSSGNSAPGVIGITSSGFSETCSSGDLSVFANTQSPTILSFIRSVVPGLKEI